MTVALEVAAGYVLGRFAVHALGLLAQVVMRSVVLRSPKWQERIRRDDALDAELKRAVGR